MFVVKQGDLFPPIDAIVRDEDDVVVDVTDATVTFSMRKSRDPATVAISAGDGEVVDGPGGRIRYTFEEGDTDETGTYEAEFEVAPLGGDPMKVPTTGYITIVVEEAVQ